MRTLTTTAAGVIATLITAALAAAGAHTLGLALREPAPDVAAATRIETAFETAFNDNASVSDRGAHLDPDGRAVAAVRTAANPTTVTDSRGYRVDVTEILFFDEATAARVYATLHTPDATTSIAADIDRQENGQWVITDETACTLLYTVATVCDGWLTATTTTGRAP